MAPRPEPNWSIPFRRRDPNDESNDSDSKAQVTTTIIEATDDDMIEDSKNGIPQNHTHHHHHHHHHLPSETLPLLFSSSSSSNGGSKVNNGHYLATSDPNEQQDKLHPFDDDDDNDDNNDKNEQYYYCHSKKTINGSRRRHRPPRNTPSFWIVLWTGFWLGFLVWRNSHRIPNPTIPTTTATTTSSSSTDDKEEEERLPPTTIVTTAPTIAPTITTTKSKSKSKAGNRRSCPRNFQNNKKKNTASVVIATEAQYSRPDFAARRNENLVLCEGFDDDDDDDDDAKDGTISTNTWWQADKTLFGEGNGGFAYYTPDNVIQEDGALHIRPGLFSDLGMITTQGGLSYPAEQVLMGNCTPFPACATLDLTHQNCTIAEFSGCERIGTPLVALNPVTSGRINTKGRFELQYGRLEARIRLPQGDWLWPALWMMPVNESNYGAWPDSGEFDILESKGNDPKIVGRSGAGRNMFSSCLHYSGNSWWKTRNSLSATDILEQCRNGSVPLEDCDWSTDYFTIGLYWSPTRMYTYALREGIVPGSTIQEEEEEIILWEVNATTGFGPNDYPLGSNFPPFSNEENTPNQNPNGPYVDVANPHKNAPFDQPFYIILNLSVGGEINGCPNPGYWGPDAIWCSKNNGNGGGETLPARTVFWNNKDLWYPSWEEAKEKKRDSFAVDWIKVWQ
jgi:hypothetical protein